MRDEAWTTAALERAAPAGFAVRDARIEGRTCKSLQYAIPLASRAKRSVARKSSASRPASPRDLLQERNDEAAAGPASDLPDGIRVGIVMGSASDWDTMRVASETLREFGVAFEARVVSAHRMPDAMFAYAEAATRAATRASNPLAAVIAGAGGAAHLPGMLASKTLVPVLGVPIPSRHLHGLDSLYSIVQMPRGIPVATFAIGAAGAANAALFAVAMLAAGDRALSAKLSAWREAQTARRPRRRSSRDVAGRSTMTRERPTVAPGGWLGLLGGGQLGRMFAMAAQSLGYRVAVLDPDRDGPAASVCDEHFEAGYLDAPALENLALQCAAVTTEFENVPAQSLAFLAEHCFTTPSAESVAVAQDRIAEKRFIASCGIAVVPHAVVEEPSDLDAVDDALFPAILKTSRMGYDGKGQARVATRAEAVEAFASLGGRPAVLETAARPRVRGVGDRRARRRRRDRDLRARRERPSRRHPRDHDGAVAARDAGARDRPRRRRAAHRARARLRRRAVRRVLRRRGGDDGLRLLVNEIAPRPHNSGHYTIDACITSQFAQQARIAAGLPLGETRRHSAAVMLNLLGDLWFADGDDDERDRAGLDRRCAATPARTCTCTASARRDAVARWAT